MQRWNFIVFYFTVCLIFLLSTNTYAQKEDMQDVVYLKNGSVIRGMIIEQIPNESLKIETDSGSLFIFTFDEISKIAKEKSKNKVTGNIKRFRKKPVLACVLSFLFPGAGQFYNDEYGKGLAQLGMVVIGFIAMQTDPDGEGIGRSGAILTLGTCLWSIIDAPISASRINREAGLVIKLNESNSLYVNIDNIANNKTITPGLKFTLMF